MNAAVVSDRTRAPRYGAFAEPSPEGDEVLVEVAACALSNLAKAQASGAHYSGGGGDAPFVPGVDGVGRLADGRRVYFAFARAPFGAMAQRTVVDRANVAPVPDDLDDVSAAALANPGMSSWAALTRRANFVAGERVWIHGATGVSGRLAVAICRHLGARSIVATGRDPARLASLREAGADAVIALSGEREAQRERFRETLGERGVDVVLDYLWGAPAEDLLAALTGRTSARAQPRVRYVQIGNSAGPTIAMPASVLRASGLELLGSGLGSLSYAALVESIARVFAAAAGAGLRVDTRTRPLREVEAAWHETDAEARLVFTLP